MEDSIELRLSRSLDKTQTERAESLRKTLTWTAGIVTVVISLLGLKTVTDLRKTAEETAISEVRKRLNLDDPNSYVIQSVSDLLAMQKIDEIVLRRASSSSRTARLTNDAISQLTEDDISKIKALSMRERTSTDDFRKAIQILSEYERTGRDASIHSFLLNIALASDPGFLYFRSQNAKRAAILETYRGPDLQSVSRAILADKDSPGTLVSAAIRYSVSSIDIAAVPLLERQSASGDEKLGDDALVAVAKLAPLSNTVKNDIRITNWKDTKSIVRLIKVASALSKPASIGPFDDDTPIGIEARSQEIQQILRLALDNGALLRSTTSFSFDRVHKYGFYVSVGSNLETYYSVSPDLITNTGGIAIDRLIKSYFARPDKLWSTLKALCLSDSEGCQGSISVQLHGPATAIVERGRVVSSSNGDRDIQVLPEAKTPDVALRWTTAMGQVQLARLAGMTDLANTKFAIVPPADLEGDQRD